MNARLVTSIAFFLALLSFGNKVQAQTLVIIQQDNSKVYYNLDEKPLTTFTPDELVITTQSVSISYPLAQIRQFRYENGTSGIEDTPRDGICISQNGSQIVVTGLPSGETVSVYSMDGKLLMKQTSDGTMSTLSTSQLPLGVFVVKAANITYKTIKR